MTSQLNLQNLWSRGRPSIFSHLEYKKRRRYLVAKDCLDFEIEGEVHKIGECIWLQTVGKFYVPRSQTPSGIIYRYITLPNGNVRLDMFLSKL